MEKTYIVDIVQTFERTVTVEASSERKARQAVIDAMDEGEIELIGSSDTSIDTQLIVRK